jgi:hypothetical protein
MRKSFIIVVITLVVFQAFSQVDSVERQILNYGNSKSVIISQGRSLLLDKFIERDMYKVKEIKDYLIEKGEDENYIAFFPVEYWLILYWTNEYEELSHSIMVFDSTRIASYRTRIRPSQDMLHTRLLLQSRENAQTITNQIQNANIDIEKRNFLQLNFESLIMKDESFQDTLNIQVENFLKSFPETEYKNFIKQHIEFKLVPKNWGMAFEFFSGYGIFTGIISNKYTNNIPIGIAFDICYKRFELYLRDYIGFNKTKKDFDYSTKKKKKGSSIMVFLPEASLSYADFDNNRFKIAPFLGIGATDISPSLGKTEKTPELKEISLEFTSTYLIGLNFDVKFGKEDYLFRPKSSYGFLRIRYGYSIPRFSKKYDGISGSMHYITIGVGGFSRGLKREY